MWVKCLTLQTPRPSCRSPMYQCCQRWAIFVQAASLNFACRSPKQFASCIWVLLPENVPWCFWFLSLSSAQLITFEFYMRADGNTFRSRVFYNYFGPIWKISNICDIEFRCNMQSSGSINNEERYTAVFHKRNLVVKALNFSCTEMFIIESDECTSSIYV